MTERTRTSGRTQLCPICGAQQPLSARTCAICGAALPGQAAPVVPVLPSASSAPAQKRARYESALGDDDLFAGDLSGRAWRLVLVGCVVLALLLGLGIGLAASQMMNDSDETPRVEVQVEGLITPQPTALPTSTLRGAPEPTATSPAPTRDVRVTLATVTPAPPTATDTPTPGPCYQSAQQGDTVLGMVYRCGHEGEAALTLVPTVLALNDMDNPQALQLGQTLEIPWPTPTGGPTGPPAAPEDGESGGFVSATPQVELNEFGTPDRLAYYENLEPTLRPGQAWYTVVAGDTVISIAFTYDTTIEMLSQLNPDIPFLGCDYGQPAGGESCSVMLVEGQRMRVPVPLPTITLTPSPVGTLTPTPTRTATFNAPFLLSPEDGARFRRDEMVTLRWGGTGTLASDERFAVRLRDRDTGETFLAVVSATSYVLPGGWQPSDGEAHRFEWTISVARVDAQNNVISESQITGPRAFSWESR